MSILIILGNTNQYTFANSLVAANQVSINKFGEPFKQIFIIHTEESFKELRQSDTEWLNHVVTQGIEKNVFVDKIIQIDAIKAEDISWEDFEHYSRQVTNKFVDNFVEYIKIILKSVDGTEDIFVDLTNGTSHHKNILSTISYILNIDNQYIMDINLIPKPFDIKTLFSSHEAIKYYVPSPNNIKIDDIAHINLSEVKRYKYIIDEYKAYYSAASSEKFDEDFFKGNLVHSIEMKLKADLQAKNIYTSSLSSSKPNKYHNLFHDSLYRISTTSIAANIEDITSFIIDNFNIQVDGSPTLGSKFKAIENKIKDLGNNKIDHHFLRSLNDIILKIRNKTVHTGREIGNTQDINAEIMTSLFFPFMRYYLKHIYPVLCDYEIDRGKYITSIEELTSPVDQEIMYFGLDGDNIGVYLEEGLSNNKEKDLSTLSNTISRTIKEIANRIKKDFQAEVIFDSGDGLLFKAPFSEKILNFIKKTFEDRVQFSTCSIGYGPSTQEAYLALKLAKSKPGKNSVVGIRIVNKQEPPSS